MDRRLESFIELCKNMNYRITAEKLHISQPALTKQMQSLEEELGIKLFIYDGRKLVRSEKSYILEQYAYSQRKNYQDLLADLDRREKKTIRIGLTKTIGEYAIRDRLHDYIFSHQENIEITVENTEYLIKMLKDCQKDFLILEGNFDKKYFAHRVLSVEKFTGLCAKKHPFAGKELEVTDLFDQVLFIREQGSGSREIFEQDLAKHGYRVEDFQRTISISSLRLIANYVESNLGITFAYDSLIQRHPGLASFKVRGLSDDHEFNIVWLKDTRVEELIDYFFQADPEEGDT